MAINPQPPSPSRAWAESNPTRARTASAATSSRSLHSRPSLAQSPPRSSSRGRGSSSPTARPSSRAAVGCRLRGVWSGRCRPNLPSPPRRSAAVCARSGRGKRWSGAGRVVAASDRSCSARSSSFRSARGRRVEGAAGTQKHGVIASSVCPHGVVCRRDGNLEKAGCHPRSEGGGGGGPKKEAGSDGWSSGPVGEAGCRGRKRRCRGSPVTSEESSTARSARRPAKLRMNPSQSYDGSQNDTSQGGFPLGGGNIPLFQGYTNPMMLGYQGGWQQFHPGMQQFAPNASMMHPSMVPQMFRPPESTSPYVQNSDVYVEEQPPLEAPTGKGKGKGKKTKQGNFNPVEDVLLVKSYLEISNDPIIEPYP
ncbi:unnamed protein product [Urochloa humidicola]